MIKEIKGIDNVAMLSNYNLMIESMYEEVADISKGFNKKIKNKLKKISLIDKKTFNFFGMYNKDIYVLYREICSEIKKIFADEKINFERSYPYLYGKIMENSKVPIGIDLNFAPNFKTVFFGFYVVNSNKDCIIINDQKNNIVAGNLIILKHNDRIQFNNMSKDLVLIEMHFSPIEYLNRQYYQKWIPII